MKKARERRGVGASLRGWKVREEAEARLADMNISEEQRNCRLRDSKERMRAWEFCPHWDTHPEGTRVRSVSAWDLGLGQPREWRDVGDRQVRSELVHNGVDNGVPGGPEPDDEAVRGKEQSLRCLGVLASDPGLAQRGSLGVGAKKKKCSIYIDVSHIGNSNGHTS